MTAHINYLSQSEADTSGSAVMSKKLTSLTSLPISFASDITRHPRFASTYTLPRSPSLPAPAPSLTAMQVNCLHSHRILHRSRNNHAPVACMLCEDTDFEQSWRCHWCCLRMCNGCREKLEAIESRDIAVLLRNLIGEGNDQASDAKSSLNNEKDLEDTIQ